MHPEASRILANIVILLKSGLFRGQHCAAVPEALQFVESMISNAQAQEEAKTEAQDVKV